MAPFFSRGWSFARQSPGARCLALTMFVLACPGEPASPAGASTPLVVPPHLEYMVVDLRGTEPGSIDIYQPGDSSPQRLDTLVTRPLVWSPRLTTVLLRQPRPGRWRFAAPQPLQVTLREIKTALRGQWLAPRRPVVAGSVCMLLYEVIETRREHRELTSPRVDPVAVFVEVQSPTGVREPVDLVPLPLNEPPRFRSPRPIQCNEPGVYWLHTTLSTFDSEGRKVVLSHESGPGFMAFAAGSASPPKRFRAPGSPAARNPGVTDRPKGATEDRHKGATSVGG